MGGICSADDTRKTSNNRNNNNQQQQGQQSPQADAQRRRDDATRANIAQRHKRCGKTADGVPTVFDEIAKAELLTVNSLRCSPKLLWGFDEGDRDRYVALYFCNDSQSNIDFTEETLFPTYEALTNKEGEHKRNLGFVIFTNEAIHALKTDWHHFDTMPSKHFEFIKPRMMERYGVNPTSDIPCVVLLRARDGFFVGKFPATECRVDNYPWINQPLDEQECTAAPQSQNDQCAGGQCSAGPPASQQCGPGGCSVGGGGGGKPPPATAAAWKDDRTSLDPSLDLIKEGTDGYVTYYRQESMEQQDLPAKAKAGSDTHVAFVFWATWSNWCCEALWPRLLELQDALGGEEKLVLYSIPVEARALFYNPDVIKLLQMRVLEALDSDKAEAVLRRLGATGGELPRVVIVHGQSGRIVAENATAAVMGLSGSGFTVPAPQAMSAAQVAGSFPFTGAKEGLATIPNVRVSSFTPFPKDGYLAKIYEDVAMKKNKVISHDKTKIDIAAAMASDGRGGHIGRLVFYFSASWCPPCRQFTPQISAAERDSRTGAKPPSTSYQLIWAPRCREKAKFADYATHMPNIPHLSFQNALAGTFMSDFGITGIPAVVVVDPATNRAVSVDAASRVRSGGAAPWA